MTMTISIDDTLKHDFSEICSEIGLSASTAFNIFAKTVVRERRIPFDLSSESQLEREARIFEHSLANAAERAYEDTLAGRTRTWEDMEAAKSIGDVA